MPIQQKILKKVISAAEITIQRLKDLVQMIKEEKDVQAVIYEKVEKNIRNNESKYLPQTK